MTKLTTSRLINVSYDFKHPFREGMSLGTGLKIDNVARLGMIVHFGSVAGSIVYFVSVE